MSGEGIARPAVSLSEAQAYVRAETGEEEALLAGLIRTASAICEAFLGQVVVAREFSEVVPASSDWQRLGVAPVTSITGVEALAPDGSLTPLAASAYGIDIDSSGDGWVRLIDPTAASRARVSGVAGMATSCNEVPEPIRQGVIRLTAHMFSARDGGGGEPPAAVTALWRPYRRMRLA